MRVMHAAALGLSVGLGALCAASCASVIGVDKYKDAAAELCDCGELSLVRDCEVKVKRRLQRDADATAAWIKDFEKDFSCSRATEILSVAPLCTPCADIRIENMTVADSRHGDFLALCVEDGGIESALQCLCGPQCKDQCKGSAVCRSGDAIGQGPCQQCTDALDPSCSTGPLVMCLTPPPPP